MDWLDIVTRFGLPTALCVAFMWAGWRAATWIAGQLIVPLRDRCFVFLDRLEQTQQTQAKTLDRIETLLQQHDSTLQALWQLHSAETK